MVRSARHAPRPAAALAAGAAGGRQGAGKVAYEALRRGSSAPRRVLRGGRAGWRRTRPTPRSSSRPGRPEIAGDAEVARGRQLEAAMRRSPPPAAPYAVELREGRAGTIDNRITVIASGVKRHSPPAATSTSASMPPGKS